MNIARIGDVSLTTVEIAEMTGKEHFHVLRDAKKMLIELYSGGGASKFGGTYIDVQNKERPCYLLPKREVMVLITGYSIPLRAAVIDRLKQLEDRLRRMPIADALADELGMCELFGVPLHIAQTEAVKRIQATKGVDISHLLSIAPAQNDIQEEDVMLEPRELGKAYGESAQWANRLLMRGGMQFKARGGGWNITRLGSKISSRHAWAKGNKSGYNYKWSLQAFENLVDQTQTGE